jgi:hypothetical protein
MGNTNVCKCEEKSFKEYVCVICKGYDLSPISEIDRRANCELHRVRMAYGNPEFVCSTCKNEGWYSTAGWGGRTQHINRNTGEEQPLDS